MTLRALGNSFGWAAMVLACAPTLAQAGSADLSASSLEDLTRLRISVHSFARKNQDLWKTPAAVYVITHEQIARSAASSIPDLLRVVPGLQVAQINASTWAVTIRGFNNQFADKVLVLVDGRTIYSEIFSGVNWDEVNVPLEEIDRIEVIRGPGAAVWGTNAVNGVINILTLPARVTSGTRISGHVSRLDDAADARWASTLGDRTHYRGYLDFLDRRPFELASGAEAYDGERIGELGGRLDWGIRADKLVFTADAYTGRLRNQIDTGLVPSVSSDGHDSESLSGGHLLGRWEHTHEQAETALQFYYADQSRHQLGTYIRTRTFDFDYQYHVPAGRYNDLVWGGETRFTSDYTGGSQVAREDSNLRNYLVDGFLQDDVSIISNRLTATLGSKVQNGTLAGFEVQPSARLLGVLSNKQVVWAAASRAAVAPAIEDENSYLSIPEGSVNGLPLSVVLAGNPLYKPEIVKAFELGYRHRITDAITLDLAGFDNENSRVSSIQALAPSLVGAPTPHLEATLLHVNGHSARTDGVEAAVAYKPFDQLEASVGYAWLQAHTRQVLPGNLVLSDVWNTPRNSGSGSLWWGFLPHWGANVFAEYVEYLPGSSGQAGSVASPPLVRTPGYARLDAHLTRMLGRSLEFDAGGTNLLTPRHLELGSGQSYASSSQVPRSLFIKAKVNF